MRLIFSIVAFGGLLGACATPAKGDLVQTDQDLFFQNLSKLCGQAFSGRMVTDHPLDADLKGKAMIMHVRNCSIDTIKIPLHVENDRSRTWIITRGMASPDGGMRLKHDHRHEDGSEDEVTQYGGQTITTGSSTRQEFPADAFSKLLFERTGRPNSSLNTWAVEIEAGKRFSYEVSRPNRYVRFEFDLAQPTQVPPPPWGTPAGK